MKRLLIPLVAIAGLCGESLAADQRPNSIFILADDYGYGSAGCYGANPTLVHTPNIDRLAKEGRRFTDANTTSSVCSPTRYSVLTGRYCWRTSLELAKNPSQGESMDAMQPLARKALKLDSNQWYPVRITFKGNEATVQVNDVVAKATHAVLSQPKTGINFLVFGETAGFRNVKVTKHEPTERP